MICFEAVGDELDFVKVVFWLVRYASEDAAINGELFLLAFERFRCAQIIFQKAQKDLIVSIVYENGPVFNSFIVYVIIGSNFGYSLKIFGRHKLTLTCKKTLCKWYLED